MVGEERLPAGIFGVFLAALISHSVDVSHDCTTLPLWLLSLQVVGLQHFQSLT